MGSEDSEEIDLDYWNTIIKETQNIQDLKDLKGKNSIVDGLIDEELIKRKNVKELIIKNDYVPPPEIFDDGFIKEEEEEEEKEDITQIKGILKTNKDGEEEWIDKQESVIHIDEDVIDESIDEDFIQDDNDIDDTILVLKKK